MDKDQEIVQSKNLHDAYQEALDKTAIVAITDLQGSITYVNDKFCEISKFSRDELIGKNHNILKSGYHSREFYKDLWGTIKRGDIWMGEIKNKAKDGSYYWVQTTIVPLLDANKKPYQYLSFRLDITEQKFAEERRVESEQLFQLVADNFPNGSISLIDLNLKVLFSAGLGYEVVNFGPADVIGKPLREVVSRQTSDFVERNLPQILAGETLSQDIFSHNHYYHIIYRPVLDSAGAVTGFVMVVLDDTESKKAALEIVRHNELFAIGEEIANIGSWDWDIETREVVFSSNTLRLLGHDPEILRKKSYNVLEWVHPGDRKVLMDAFQKMLINKKSETLEFRMIRKDGAIRIFQSSSTMKFMQDGQRQHVIGILKDVTEEREREAALAESREILSKIADNIPGLVMRYVERQGKLSKVQYISKGAESLFEISKEDIGLNIDAIWSKIHHADVRGVFRSFIRAKKNVEQWNHEFRIAMPDGRMKWISMIGTPKITGPESYTWDVLALDISAKKAAEESIEKNLEILTFQNRQLLDFCNIVSHNLRSPLVNMSMLIGFIEESSDEEERRVYIEKLKPVIDGLNETFEELVESIQIRQDSEIKSDKIDIKESFEKIIAGFEGQIIQSEAIIETDFSQAPTIYYPTKYWYSVLQNLISNAIKYRSPDRRLTIKIKAEPISDNKILLSVQDNGLGIDLKRHQNNIFKIRKVFHRHPDAKGFGLFITKTQVEAMKGKIWVESVPDVGSTFFVIFNDKGNESY